ncbi:MAG: 50S ribosomal protein L11 methyltransferase [candidate division Zixibacteria bacterium]|jgi:ribosomal protein L11 methyltransferase|nr:50S ribosomal protein L11 methyltransferase [candidate division Zixibacteria bacterium]
MNEVQPDRYIEARIDVPRPVADAVCNYIIDNLTRGMILEEEEGSAITGIIFYLPETFDPHYKERLTEYIQAISDDRTFEPTVREKLIKNVEWVQQYRESIRPLVVAGDVVVRPPWEQAPEGAFIEIVIEPKMAFGTGSHETTRSCMGVLRSRIRGGERFLDVGTGSGILSILADKLGAGYIKAIDYDEVAVENCRENFVINDVSAPHEVALGTISRADDDDPYDIVVANIIKSTILPWLDRLVALTARPGLLILSGLLESDVPEITGALAGLRQANVHVIEDNAWRTVVVERQ